MRYAPSPAPLLGPCPCQDCGEPLFWAKGRTRRDNVIVLWLAWREWNGHLHKCPKAIAA